MDPILGEVRLVGFAFAPPGWLPCDGRLLEVQRYAALHALLGYTYGGSANVFALPDLRERVVIGAGEGADLTPRQRGAAPGSGRVALTPEELPAHTHALQGSMLVSQQSGTTADPAGAYLAGGPTDQYGEDVDGNTMAPGLARGTAQVAGAGEEHFNLMPSLVLNYLICTEGVYPG